MSDFDPFDSEFKIDKSVLTKDIPVFLEQSLRRWIDSVFHKHSFIHIGPRGFPVIDGAMFLHPLQETFRREFSDDPETFYNEMLSNIKLFRNMLSYILQNITDVNEARALETILARSSSAYAVDFIKGKEIISGLKRIDGKPMFEDVGCKLIYRVAPIVRMQAEDVLSSENLLAEAWEAYYGMQPDDEKTVIRCTDALAGLLRDAYFPTENRPVFGSMLQKMKQVPGSYTLPANCLYDTKEFLELMKDFSKIRGNHQKGTGRKPTHEEAGFVLHFAIMFFQLLKIKK